MLFADNPASHRVYPFRTGGHCSFIDAVYDVSFRIPGDASGVSTIGAFAFTGRKIESITIPASVTSIGAYAFEDCDDLTSITFEDGEAPLVFGAAYGSYTGNVLNGTLVEKVDFPARLTVLSDQAFYYNDSTTEVTFPENSRLTTIGAEAFKYGNLQKISQYIFIITPSSVDISGDFQDIFNGSVDVPGIR